MFLGLKNKPLEQAEMKMQQFEGFTSDYVHQIEEITGVPRCEWKPQRASIAGLETQRIGDFVLLTEVTSSGSWYYHYLFDSQEEAAVWGQAKHRVMLGQDIEDPNAPYCQERNKRFTGHGWETKPVGS